MEKNKKSNGINLELTNRFSPIYVDTQHLSMAQETNTPLETPHTSFNNIRTSSDVAATVQNERPPICTTENYLKNCHPFTAPGNSEYASIAKHGRKLLIVGDSHVRRIRRNDFNKELKNGKAIFRSFSGANTKQLNHYMVPPLVDDKPDTVIIHIVTNDVLENANHEDIVRNIIKIGLECKKYGVNDIVISSVLVKRSPKLNTIIRRANEMLCDLCRANGFGFICNDMITTQYLWNDDIHLQDLGTNILSSNFINFVNNFLTKNVDNRF